MRICLKMFGHFSPITVCSAKKKGLNTFVWTGHRRHWARDWTQFHQ
jgi:hypothetical protein